MVIVGGGVAGVAVAYHLLREMNADGRIHVVEMGPWLGRGIAYGVESEVFRLNVPASRMSLDPEVPDDFVAFSGSGSDAACVPGPGAVRPLRHGARRLRRARQPREGCACGAAKRSR